MSSPTSLRVLRVVFDGLYVLSFSVLALIVLGSLFGMGAPVFIIGIFVWHWTHVWMPDVAWLPFVIVGIVFALLLVAPFAFQWVARRLEQKARDREARAVLAAIGSAGPVAAAPKFLLYLRPFWSTGSFIEYADIDMADPLIGFSTIDFELEEQVRKGLRSIGPLIALGAPGEHFGAGRLPVAESDWKQKIQLLMQHATWIVAVPSGRPGTLWELEQIFTHGFEVKTLFVMPPSAGHWRKKRDVIVADWSDAAEKVKAFGFALPAHRPEGSVLYYTSRSIPALTESLRLDRPGTWTDVIARVLAMR